MSELLRPITGPDGAAWDGLADLRVGRKIYYAAPRFVTTVERVTSLTANNEITGILDAGETLYVLGWVRGNTYISDDRYWVTELGEHVPVYGTAEKPV